MLNDADFARWRHTLRDTVSRSGLPEPAPASLMVYTAQPGSHELARSDMAPVLHTAERMHRTLVEAQKCVARLGARTPEAAPSPANAAQVAVTTVNTATSWCAPLDPPDLMMERPGVPAYVVRLEALMTNLAGESSGLQAFLQSNLPGVSQPATSTAIGGAVGGLLPSSISGAALNSGRGAAARHCPESFTSTTGSYSDTECVPLNWPCGYGCDEAPPSTTGEAVGGHDSIETMAAPTSSASDTDSTASA